jgi:folate-binding protein YgfZ
VTDSPVVFTRRPWGLVVVAGPDATTFLQSIVSQDLDPVAVGETVASLLLHPQGKLDVVFRATRVDDAAWWLDTEPQAATRLAAGLARFRIRVDVDIQDRTADSACASVVAPPDLVVALDALTIPTRWGPREGVDVVGPASAVDAWVLASGLGVGSAAELEALRIASGVPTQGVDVDETTIPQEAFLEVDAVSFTKGCFVGQELVCRIDSRGHVNRFLRRLTLPGVAVPPPGADVVHDGRTVGAVTSAAPVPGEDRVVALAMVRREVEPPAEVTVTVAGVPVPGLVS